MLEVLQLQIRDDCLASLKSIDGLVDGLRGQHIAVVGGTGFVGTWLAESVAALNDQFGVNIHLHLLGRGAAKWAERHAHLRRSDIETHVQDVRSPFELPRDVSMVIFAAGIADPRVWVSEPQRVFETSVYGINHALSAALRLENLQRFVNISSALVAGPVGSSTGLREEDTGNLDFTRFHNLYAEARRAAESLACGFAGQHRVPLSTARAFTFLGPYQGMDAPWAVNNFIRDSLGGHEIRVHGDGAPRRGYLYGSDVAAWLLKIAVAGADGGIYNVGSAEAISHAQAAAAVAAQIAPETRIIYSNSSREDGRNKDLYPNLTKVKQELALNVSMDFSRALSRTIEWAAHGSGAAHKVKVFA